MAVSHPFSLRSVAEKKWTKVLKAAMLFQDFKHLPYVRIRELPYRNQPWMSQSRLIRAQMSTFDIIPFDKVPDPNLSDSKPANFLMI